jgi:rhodanese-related sulfurtransferase
MKKLLLSALVLALMMGGAVMASTKKDPKEITAEQLKSMMSAKKAPIVVDARGGKYFDGEMIQGAVNLPADKTDAQSLEKIAPSKNAKLVFYCQNTACPASAIAGKKAQEAGYHHVYRYEGGIEEWKAKGFPTTQSKS